MRSSKQRVLIAGTAVAAGEAGGLQIALRDIARELEARGWQVDLAIEAGLAGRELRSMGLRSQFDRLHRSAQFHQLKTRVPPQTREWLVQLARRREYYDNASTNLDTLQRLLAARSPDDVILLSVDSSAPGAACLAAETHPRVVMTSLGGLATELRHWAGLRRLASLRVGGAVHPYLFRRLPPDQVKLALFASRVWQEQALGAGLPPSVARVIYIGVPLPPPQPRPASTGGRLLWVGRLAPEKGLHLLLPALPAIRRHIPGATLTVVAAQTPDAYQALIHDLVRRYELSDCVRILPAVPRAALQRFYAEHDALLFYSVNAEPVALVMMEAMAVGLPVVCSRTRPDALLTQDGVTCVQYDPNRPETIVAAVTRLHADQTRRRAMAEVAQQLVRSRFSVAAMGQAYHDALTQFAMADAPAVVIGAPTLKLRMDTDGR